MEKIKREIRVHKTIMINKSTYDYLREHFGTACLSRVVRVLTDDFVTQHQKKEQLIKELKKLET